MKALKIILLLVPNVIFITLFGLFFLLLFPLYYVLIIIRTKWSHNAVQVLNRIWAYVAATPILVFTVSQGKRKIPRNQVYIIVANHASYWDIPVCTAAMPVQFRFMGKVELVNIPLFGKMFREVHIPVNRGNRLEAARSLELAKEKLAQGVSVLLYPEGTIPDKKTVTLGPFKDGAFRLAVETGIPLLPVTLLGSDSVLPDEKPLLMRPAKIVKVLFDDPIPTQGLTTADIPALRQRVYDQIFAHLTAKN